ncbi:MAG TPA: hypothetical protein VMT75_01550 [Candidatus Saccharimonadales bacterium]|nr:hypothetical protein [Candidatus Saccharimonadales bacterium]
MASQPQISSYTSEICADASPAKPPKLLVPGTREHTAINAQQIVAHSLEFVARPGRAEGIQSEIPLAMGHAFSAIDGFVGCLVLVSEQEARLVTIITLWKGSNRLERCNDSTQRLQKWLAPYVDSWLRTRAYTSFVTAPHQSLTASGREEPATTHLQ